MPREKAHRPAPLGRGDSGRALNSPKCPSWAVNGGWGWSPRLGCSHWFKGFAPHKPVGNLSRASLSTPTSLVHIREGLWASKYRNSERNNIILNYFSIGKGLISSPSFRFPASLPFLHEKTHKYHGNLTHNADKFCILSLLPVAALSQLGLFEFGTPWFPHPSASSPLGKHPRKFPAVWVNAKLKIQPQEKRSRGGSNSNSVTPDLVHSGVKTKPLLQG